MASMSIHAGAGAGIEGWKVSTAYRSLTAQQHYWLETHIMSADTPVIKLPKTYRTKGTEHSKQAVCMHAHPAVGCTVRARQRSATRACGQRGCGPAARRRIHA